MKILHVMASCSRSSGVAQVIMSYYRRIYRDVTFDFLLFWQEDASFEEEILSCGGHVFYTGKPGVRDISAYLRTVDDFFSQHRGEYDAVHLHELYLNTLIFPIAKKYGIKTRIAHSHTTKFSDQWSHAVRNRLLCLPISLLATDFFACSRAAGSAAFGSKVVSEHRLYVLSNAIDPQRFIFSADGRGALRKEFGLEEDFVVGNIGRFSPQKNHELLLRIFQKLLEKKPNARLLLVGDGSLKDAITLQARRLGIMDRVVFAGERSDVGALLSAMDCFVLPSRFEGLGIVLVEAQCNGLPCIASDVVPEEAEILPSFCRLSLRDRPARWADAILCAEPRTSDTENLIFAAHFDIAQEAPRLLEKYDALIRKN